MQNQRVRATKKPALLHNHLGETMVVSRLWLKAVGLILCIVALCALAIAAAVIPLVQRSTTAQEEKYAVSLVDQVINLVEAKHQEIESFRRLALEARKRELKEITSVLAGYLDAERAAAQDNPGAQAAARTRALEFARQFRYGQNDYVWASDFASRLISHPDPKLHGADFSQVKDVYGNLIVPPLVSIAREQGEGYYSYWWNRLGKDKPSEKLTYSRLYEPWSWVIGTGVYVDDITEEVARRRAGLITELREALRKVTVGRTGYMYVFDADMNMIIHPNPKLEGTNFATTPDPLTSQSLGAELKDAARTGLPLRYVWDRPDEPGNYVYEKISWVRRHPGFDWYIASSAYTHELYEDTRALSARIAWIAFAVFAASAGLGGLFIRRLVLPISRLSRTALAVQAGDLTVRSGIDRQDEIGILSREFDAMVGKLADHVATLDAKVREKTAELASNLARLEEANRQIMDGIAYARTIQRAILPGAEQTPAAVRDHFVVWKPKDVIGGDVFWLHQDGDDFLLAAADCTGHGVPGAVMTMVAVMALNRLVREHGSADPALLLRALNRTVRRTLNQDAAEARTDDGMDIALCRIEPGRSRAVFSGARLGLYLAENGAVEEIRGDRHSVGYRSSDPEFPFAATTVDLRPGASLYLATDGLLGQAGGTKGLPFGKNRFKAFLEANHARPMAEQRAALLAAFAEYRGDQEQRDDITVIGLRI
ncbi:MAG: cache domain-containing protein [Thermodesulfobacteriota bacterium]